MKGFPVYGFLLLLGCLNCTQLQSTSPSWKRADSQEDGNCVKNGAKQGGARLWLYDLKEKPVILGGAIRVARDDVFTFFSWGANPFESSKSKGSTTVDGRHPAPVEVGSLSHYLQGLIHLRWLFGISAINSMIQGEDHFLRGLWRWGFWWDWVVGIPPAIKLSLETMNHV